MTDGWTDICFYRVASLLKIVSKKEDYKNKVLWFARKAAGFYDLHENLVISGGVGLMTLFSVATDIYSKMDSDDVTCQKKVICEFMKDNKMFGQYLEK